LITDVWRDVTNIRPQTPAGTWDGYNAVGDITSWTQQSGTNTSAFQYGYDGADQLLSASLPNAGQSPVDAYGYRYDPAGNRTGEQINTTLTTSAYNSLNQLTSVSGSTGLQLTISGSLSESGTVAAGGKAVVTDINNNFTIAVPVNLGSNNIPITATATGTGNYVTSGTLQVSATAGASIPQIQYDLNGNLTCDGAHSYVCDSVNRLAQIWYSSTVGTGSSTTMSYDGRGRRVQIVDAASSGTTTKNLVWDGMSICEEKNASGAVTKRYFDQGVQIGGSNYYYTRDHLGSIRELTDANGVVQARYNYDPYGRQTQVSGTMSADFGYTGDYFHVPSQLCLTVYREYSPNLGRWLSRDPLDNAEKKQGPNLYEYVWNDPTNNVDPDGLEVDQCLVTRLWNFAPKHVFIVVNGVTYGIGPSGNPFGSPRSPTSDQDYYNNRNNPGLHYTNVFCNQVNKPDCCTQAEFDSYVVEEAGKQLNGNYCVFGSNCADWAGNVIAAAIERCKKKCCHQGH
jgi:RHS repeat-associated protein